MTSDRPIVDIRPEPSRCERTALCSSCGAALSCEDCGGKHSTCSDAQCDIHRPCPCGEDDCHWSGAGEVIHALGWHDAPKPKLSQPTGTGERLSKPWTAAEHQARLAAEPKETP